MTAEHTHPHEAKIHHISKQETVDRNDVQTFIEWTAPDRPYIKKSKGYYVNLLLIMLTLEVILFLFAQYLLMLVIASFTFLAYAFAHTPPTNIKYRISSEGLAIEDHFYLWQELYDFYFKQRNKSISLHVRTKAVLPGELIILLGDIPKDEIKQLLLPFLPYREFVHTTFTERAGDWLVKTFPLENPRS